MSTFAYFKMNPQEICKDIINSLRIPRIKIKELDFFVYPNVYPSDKFRTTNFLLDSIYPLLPGKRICDMGCGCGVVGLYSIHNGAELVVQADINPAATRNTRANRKLQGHSGKTVKIYTSDCFDKIPKQKFDLIIFNIPFHSEPYDIKAPLEYAFHDPDFASTKKFLKQALKYCNADSIILIAFSNKGDTTGLEKIFGYTGYEWTLWKRTNTHQEYDNRIYKLNIKSHVYQKTTEANS